MIEKVLIATLGAGQDEISAPPGQLIELQVIAGMAYLGVREVNEDSGVAEDLTGDELVVPARSLLRALLAAVEDDEAPLPVHLARNL